MKLDTLKVCVIGAGIGGLAVARALALRGADVSVLEQAPEISEVGAGLQISPNGFAVLRALGLDAALRARAVQAGVEPAGSVARFCTVSEYYPVMRCVLRCLLTTVECT